MCSSQKAAALHGLWPATFIRLRGAWTRVLPCGTRIAQNPTEYAKERGLDGFAIAQISSIEGNEAEDNVNILD